MAKEPEPGDVVGGDFRIVRALSSGGMGAVYVAEQLSVGRRRALKVMHGTLLADDKLRDRFVQEAKIGATIDSEHVVEVISSGFDNALGAPWLAMELLEGVDLAAHISNAGALPAAEVREIFDQLCHALGAAHVAGVVHRDLKPENVFIARSKRKGAPFVVKVLDFGIAKVVAEARATSPKTMALGTPLFMAPEQTETGGKITPATDVWALGLIAFAALTGKSFWRSAHDEAATINVIMREVLFEPIPAASERARQLGVGALPEGFDEWFARCVARSPNDRYHDAAEAFASLAASLDRAQRSTKPIRQPDPIDAPAEAHRAGTVPAAPLELPLAGKEEREKEQKEGAGEEEEPQSESEPKSSAESPRLPRAEPTVRSRKNAIIAAGIGALAIAAVGIYSVSGNDKKPRGNRRDAESVAATTSADVTTAKSTGSAPATSGAVGATGTIDLSKLNERERTAAMAQLEKLPSPCPEMVVSLAQCVSEKRACNACKPAADFVVRQVRAGKTDDELGALYKSRFSPSEVKKVEIGNSPSQGPESAPVTIVEWADFQCPGCYQFRFVLELIGERFPGQVRLVYKFYKINALGHEHSLEAAYAAQAAHLQGKFWPMHKQIFDAFPTGLTPADLPAFARTIGLDLDKYNKDVASPATKTVVEDDMKQADSLGLNGTPFVLINGRVLPSEALSPFYPELEAWVKLDIELAGQTPAQPTARYRELVKEYKLDIPTEGEEPPAQASATASNAQELETLRKRAFEQTNRGDNRAAVETAKAVLAIDKTDALMWLYLGSAYMSLGKMTEAKEAFNDCVRYGKGEHVKECVAFGGKK